VVVGRADVDRLAAALLPFVDRETLVVVSSDLSHFLPYAEAQAKDRRTIDAILARDRRVLVQDAASACGAHALAILLATHGLTGADTRPGMGASRAPD
jgi:AmmeMemoRadiSam system protein B